MLNPMIKERFIKWFFGYKLPKYFESLSDEDKIKFAKGFIKGLKRK